MLPNRSILIWLTALLCLPVVGQAASTIDVTSQIKEVTVFLNGAQVKRTASRTIPSGTHYLKFTGLSTQIDPNSIQVNGRGSATILSVSHSINYLQEGKKPARLISLEDSLSSLEFELNFNNQLKTVYQDEKAMILANKKVDGGDAGFNTEDVEDLADFYRDRLSDIMLKVLELDTKKKKISKDLQRVRKQLNSERSKWQQATGEVTVEVAVANSNKVAFTLSYLVRSAGWVPAYDLRVDGINEPVIAKYNARVYQSSGINWENVKLTLSTGSPQLSGDRPVLEPWRLDFARDNMQYNLSYNGRKSKQYLLQQQSNFQQKLEQSEPAAVQLEDNADKEPELTTPVALVTSGQTNIAFEIELPYNIPTDGKPHVVNIKDLALPAVFHYYSVPKMEQAAFLVARIHGWDAFNLLSGEANLYFEDTYLGQSFVDTRKTQDTLEISLGRDKGVVIERKKIEDLTSTKVVGSNKKEVLGIEINVRNTKNAPVELTIEDQVPLSVQKAIEVDLEDAGGAVHNEKSGSLRWKMTLQPASNATRTFRYSVKYPKDNRLSK